jgi:hypothetical protein
MAVGPAEISVPKMTLFRNIRVDNLAYEVQTTCCQSLTYMHWLVLITTLKTYT